MVFGRASDGREDYSVAVSDYFYCGHCGKHKPGIPASYGPPSRLKPHGNPKCKACDDRYKRLNKPLVLLNKQGRECVISVESRKKARHNSGKKNWEKEIDYLITLDKK